MELPLIVARCSPDESINPYPALLWSATACAVLLSLDVFALLLTARRFHQARQIYWLSRMRQVLHNLTGCAALLAWVLVAWLGWLYLHFVTFCSIGGYYAPYRVFQAGQAAVLVVVLLTALFLVGGLVLLAGQIWLNKAAHLAS